MAKGAYVGVDGVARKIKKGYVGVDSKARKIKKAYVGVGGVARPFWGGGKLSYYGAIDPLITHCCGLGGVSVGQYALFGGGYKTRENSYVSDVNAYDSSLVRTTPSALSVPRTGGTFGFSTLAATSVGRYALFGGGYIAA